MKSIEETKQYLQSISDYRKRLEIIHKAGDAAERAGIDREYVEAAEIERISQQISEAVRMMTRLKPAECEVLLARYVDGQPYETLHEHPYLKGMSDRQCWRLLATAIEHYSENVS